MDFPGKLTGVVAISSSRASSRPRDRTRVSCLGRRVLYHLSRQGIFPTQGWNLCLLPWSAVLYYLSRQGSLVVSCCCFSVAQLCPTLCGSVDRSPPSFPVLCCLPAFAQTHVHHVIHRLGKFFARFQNRKRGECA